MMKVGDFEISWAVEPGALDQGYRHGLSVTLVQGESQTRFNISENDALHLIYGLKQAMRYRKRRRKSWNRSSMG